MLNQFSLILSMGGAVDHPGNTSPVSVPLVRNMIPRDGGLDNRVSDSLTE